jgi:hypothetical protein
MAVRGEKAAWGFCSELYGNLEPCSSRNKGFYGGRGYPADHTVDRRQATSYKAVFEPENADLRQKTRSFWTNRLKEQ